MLLPGGGHGAQGRGAEGLGAQGEVLHQQVVLQVGLMGRGAGLHQELSHIAVELGEHHRVPVVDHLNQVGGLALGLVGGVPVQIEAVVVAAGVVGAPVGVLVGADDKDDVVQDVVHVQRDVLAGRQPDIQVNVDATRMSQAFTGNGYIQNIINGEVNSFVARYRDNSEPLVSLETRMRFNPNLDPAWFGGVMAIINNITMLAIVLTGSALIREREHGTVEHLLVMPITPFEIMMAKIWSMGLVVLVVSGLSLVLMVKGVLGVPIEGSIPLFMLGVALSLFATTSIGIFMGTIARSMPQLGLLVILVLLPLQMLSGGSTPRESMPQMVQDIMLTMPTTHFVSLAQAILYRGAGFEIVWPQFLTLMAIGGAFFTIALLRFRKRIGTMA